MQTRITLFLLSLFLLLNRATNAQTIPDVASLNKFIDVPVDKSTGIPNIDIPFYTLQEKDFSLPISLSYHAGGIRVEEIASDFGLGFALNAGGTISRTVRGLPDDGGTGFYVHGGSAYPFLPPTLMPPVFPNATGTAGNHMDGAYDTEPDLFYFNVNGYSGKFMFGKNNKILLVPEQDIKIEVISGTLFSWKVTTPDGTQYLIGGNTDQSIGEFSGSPYSSAWHLGRIITANTDTIDFEYQQTGGEQRVLRHTYQLVRANTCLTPSISAGFQIDYGYTISKIKSKSCTIEFNHKTSIREDYKTGSVAKAIDNIQVIDNADQTTKLKYVFHTSYFTTSAPTNGLSADNYLQKRLRLDSIVQEGQNGDALPPYKFYYNKHNPIIGQLPSRLSAAQDDWGYYNGNENNKSLFPNYTLPGQDPTLHCPDLGYREARDEYKKAFILDEIVFPSAAVTTFSFESIPYVFENSTTIGGLRIKKIITHTGSGMQTKKFDYETPYPVGGTPQYLQILILNSQPAYPIGGCPQTGIDVHYILFTDPVNNAGLVSNYIIHGKVTESEASQGSTESYFNIDEMGNEVPFDITVYPSALTGTILNGGKIINEIVKDSEGRIKKQTNFTYDKVGSVVISYPDCYNVISPLCVEEPYYYTITTGFGYLKQKEEILSGKNYETNNNDAITTITKYEYGGLANVPEASKHYQLTKITVNSSDGNSIITKMKYAPDYFADMSGFLSTDIFDPVSDGIRSLISKNIISQPIETIKIKTASGAEMITGGVLSFYQNTGSFTKLSKSLLLNITGSFAYNSSFDSRIQKSGNTYSFIHDTRYKERESYKYNATANLIESSLLGGLVKSTIWGYSNQYATAQVSNAEADEVYYEGFETSGTLGIGHTGKRYLDNGSGFITSNKVVPGLHGKNYLLSWWHLDGSDWKYSEVPFNGQSITDPVVDDVRIYPTGAQMVSYTYEPLTGVTSITNPASITTHYKYDNLQRLQTIFDTHKNILKDYKYDMHATTLYGNEAKSQSFSKGNCGSGYTGTPVIYKVPAGKYHSLISPEDANDKALAEISANGQAYSDVQGSCLFNYYSEACTGSFTRNNCLAGTGSSVSFSVPAGTFISTVSQSDANQQALTYLNDVGQTRANENGTCPAATIYARLERDNVYQYSSGGYSTNQADYNIHFYSNSACTQPTALETTTTFYLDYSTLHSDMWGSISTYSSHWVVQGFDTDTIVYLGNYSSVDTDYDGSFTTTDILFLSGNPNIIVIN